LQLRSMVIRLTIDVAAVVVRDNGFPISLITSSDAHRLRVLHNLTKSMAVYSVLKNSLSARSVGYLLWHYMWKVGCKPSISGMYIYSRNSFP
jgi:hypothetical protein